MWKHLKSMQEITLRHLSVFHSAQTTAVHTAAIKSSVVESIRSNFSLDLNTKLSKATRIEKYSRVFFIYIKTFPGTHSYSVPWLGPHAVRGGKHAGYGIGFESCSHSPIV